MNLFCGGSRTKNARDTMSVIERKSNEATHAKMVFVAFSMLASYVSTGTTRISYFMSATLWVW